MTDADCIVNRKTACKGRVITQEVKFGGKVESVAVWHKSVVALILRFDIINGQFVDPDKISKSSVYDVPVLDQQISRSTMCVIVSSPANVRDIYSAIMLDLDAILEPGAPHVLVRHFALKNGLVLRLHGEVGDTLVDLKFLLCTVRKTKA